MGFWQSITAWLHGPFKQPLDMTNWVLLVILSATIAYAWSRVLDRVLEE